MSSTLDSSITQYLDLCCGLRLFRGLPAGEQESSHKMVVWWSARGAMGSSWNHIRAGVGDVCMVHVFFRRRRAGKYSHFFVSVVSRCDGQLFSSANWVLKDTSQDLFPRVAVNSLVRSLCRLSMRA